MICKECGAECADYRVLGTHISKIHHISTEEYYRKHLLTDNSDKCLECGNECNFINLRLGYHTFCSISCQSKASNRKRECFFATDEGKQKIRETLLKRYGVIHNSYIHGITEKRNKTHKENTGYDLWNDPDVIAKRNDTRSKHDYTEAYKTANEKKLVKYGNKCNYEKVKETIKTKYGVENPFQSKEIMNACWTRYKERTGYDIPAHNPEVIKKAKQRYVYDNQNFDSSWELAYYIWLKDHDVDFVFHPNISFSYYTADGKEHKYFPDFKVKNEYVEIKGDHLLSEEWTTNEKLECIRTHGKILCSTEIQPVLNYILLKYGKNYLKQFKKGGRYEK